MLDFRTETFLTVCRVMNYTTAAKQLHITQPAVSQHIHYLEEYYQTRLFEYENKKLKLTKSGEILRQALSASVNDENYLKDEIKKADLGVRLLNFGVTRTIGEYVIGKPLAGFIKNHDEYCINMTISNTHELVERVLDGSINFAIVEGFFDHNSFDSAVFDTVSFIPVCNINHEFKKKPESITDLFEETLLIREEGSGTREIMEKHISAMNYSMDCFKKTITIGGMHTILQLLQNDVGITFLFDSAARELIDDNAIMEIKIMDFKVKHDYAFIWERGSRYGDEYKDICRQFRLGAGIKQA